MPDPKRGRMFGPLTLVLKERGAVLPASLQLL